MHVADFVALLDQVRRPLQVVLDFGKLGMLLHSYANLLTVCRHVRFPVQLTQHLLHQLLLLELLALHRGEISPRRRLLLVLARCCSLENAAVLVLGDEVLEH